MKALLYKELKLAIHPMCYIFLFTFPLMVLIPKYPLGIGFIYVLSVYPILFLGANKGQQSNDLLFSVLLPIRKKDIVLARIITLVIYQFAFILLNALLIPFAYLIQQAMLNNGVKDVTNAGLSIKGYVSLIAFVLLGYSVADLLYLCLYYRNGKSILLPTLLSIIGFAIYISVVTIGLPYVPFYYDIFEGSGLPIQFVILGVSLLLYFLMHVLTFKISSKNLEKVDF